MSQTYEICCTRCKKSLWVGQSERIYSTDRHIEHLAIFLHAHQGHPLIFSDSGSDIASECDEVSEAMDEAMQRISNLGKS